MKSGYLKYLFLLAVTSLSQTTNAQSVWDRLHLGFGLGTQKYAGDVAKSQSKFAFSPSLEFEITDQLSVRGQAILSSIAAGPQTIYPNLESIVTDPTTAAFNFKSATQDVSLQALYNFFNLNLDQIFTPYAFAGIGMIHFSPYQRYYYSNTTTDQDGNQTQSRERIGKHYYSPIVVDDRDIKTYSNAAVNIPYGVGVRMAATHNIRFSLEYARRFVFSDNMDHVFNGKKDNFYNLFLGVSFRLGSDGVTHGSGSKSGDRNYNRDCPPVY